MAHSALYIRIMNSSAWRTTRAQKLAVNPLCELCFAEGIYKPAQCVHHLTEIESAKTDREAYALATSASNLQSLCYRHHHLAHCNTKGLHEQRNGNRLEQWKSRHGV